MNRDEQIARLQEPGAVWDILVIGGGATGVGIAVDAASRGYRACLVEQSDFGKGTSSRSTKLIHGGVRYLQQGNIGLVREALRERGILRRNAPHLVHELPFVIPAYDWWQKPYYGAGLKAYDLLAGSYGFPRSRMLGAREVLQHAPTLLPEGLRGGLLYYDGQFDDARLLIALAQTAVEQGACLANYATVVGLKKDASGHITGARVRDEETGNEIDVAARVVVNAAGPFIDDLRRLDAPDVDHVVAPSQGVHLVFDGGFLPGDAAIVVPRTPDGRVLFAIPWLGKTLVGTTDTPIRDVSLEPRALDAEVKFILGTVSRYLVRPPTRADVRSVFTGIRPLVKQSASGSTAALSREHSIFVSPSGLVSIAGGKWTTYRVMARDCVDFAARTGGLPPRPSVTQSLRLHGHPDTEAHASEAAELARLIAETPAWGEPLHPDVGPRVADVVWSVRREMARTVEDVLARRSRALFLDAPAAVAMASRVASIMAAELGRDAAWAAAQVRAFEAVATGYVVTGANRPGR